MNDERPRVCEPTRRNRRRRRRRRRRPFFRSKTHQALGNQRGEAQTPSRVAGLTTNRKGNTRACLPAEHVVYGGVTADSLSSRFWMGRGAGTGYFGEVRRCWKVV